MIAVSIEEKSSLFAKQMFDQRNLTKAEYIFEFLPQYKRCIFPVIFESTPSRHN